MNGRRIFVGDIQGCREELERLLGTTRFDPGIDRLFFVGDVVNRGPDSLGTLRLLKAMGAQGVLGNHDLHLMAVHRGERLAEEGDGLGEVLGAPDCDELMTWLASFPFIRTWNDVILVHAGISPRWRDPREVLASLRVGDDSPAIDFATRVRWCDEDGRMTKGDPPAEPGFRPWYEHLAERHRETIIFGHWARAGLIHRPGFRGLDTGCVWGGRLTAWIAETDEIVSVPAARAYAAPGEETRKALK